MKQKGGNCIQPAWRKGPEALNGSAYVSDPIWLLGLRMYQVGVAYVK